MKVEIQAITKPTIEEVDGQDFVAYVARIGRLKDNPERLIKYLIKNKHWSPLEHTYITFKIETSMAIGEQLLRHRSFTFQKKSGRYEEMTEFESIEFRKQSEINRQSSTILLGSIDYVGDYVFVDDYSGAYKEIFEETAKLLKTAQSVYEKLVNSGVAKECARMILPACTKTTMLMTGNLRSWFHFLEIRDDEHAQKECQLIAKEIKKVLTEKFPIIFDISKDNEQ